ncbi:MAG: type II toxin-antitoxin system VapC family toxin [Deltaproteobacteria bacterium]|nr:type II toxin-antitoxin system VapC family toxin [Deltaproteobacteria bacterium]
MIWVLDASVAVRWFIEEETHPLADEVLEKVINEPEKFAVPELFAFEVFSVLQRLHPNGLEAFRKGIIPLLQGGIFRQPMTESLAVKANRFVKLGLTGYDACYAALARDLKGRWLTFDEKAHRLIQEEKASFFLEDGMPENWYG